MNSATSSKNALPQNKIFQKTEINPPIDVDRTIEWIGGVNQEKLQNVLSRIKDLLKDSPRKKVNLFITSPGGPTGLAMSFYDMINKILKVKLCTIGSGDVDSSGIILFMSGEERILTSNTTLLLHMAGRRFDGSSRYTTSDMSSMLEEDHIKDHQYASIVSERSEGKLSKSEVMEMMRKGTILDAQEALDLGLAHKII